MMRAVVFAFTLAALSLLCACGGPDVDVSAPKATTALPPPPPPRDVGDIGHFLGCEAKPRRDLSPRERCEIEAFRARCTALDDCYVSCISSPDGVSTGGRCAHVCTMGPHRGAPHPPAVQKCETLPGPSGIDVGRGVNPLLGLAATEWPWIGTSSWARTPSDFSRSRFPLLTAQVLGIGVGDGLTPSATAVLAGWVLLRPV